MTDTHGELFHAYVVGGQRDTARACIEELLAPIGGLASSDSDIVVTEHVTCTVDVARQLRSWQELSAVKNRKVYILYTDFITREAENALLKTLEEPIANTHIILAVPNPAVLLETLLSRVRVLVPETENISGGTSNAKKFLGMSRAERFAYIETLLEKSDDEDASAEVRQRAIIFVEALEKTLASLGVQENAKKLESLLRLKKYLYVSGASVRMILETIAFSV